MRRVLSAGTGRGRSGRETTGWDMRKTSRALVQRGTSLDILRTIRINKRRRRLSRCTLSACKACADRRAPPTERIACGGAEKSRAIVGRLTTSEY